MVNAGEATGSRSCLIHVQGSIDKELIVVRAKSVVVVALKAESFQLVFAGTAGLKDVWTLSSAHCLHGDQFVTGLSSGYLCIVRSTMGTDKAGRVRMTRVKGHRLKTVASDAPYKIIEPSSVNVGINRTLTCQRSFTLEARIYNSDIVDSYLHLPFGTNNSMRKVYIYT
ncbi:hypothetical protein KM043_012599 [Ampulex compressa]|nr:hypothetical protein KM043_012599 [Ampulex compressa]